MKYTIKEIHTVSYEFTVDANSEEEALEKVQELDMMEAKESMLGIQETIIEEAEA